jgi:hypothetical protein
LNNIWYLKNIINFLPFFGKHLQFYQDQIEKI